MTKPKRPNLPAPIRDLPTPVLTNCVGAVVSYAAGKLSVDYPQNPRGPMPALCVLNLSEPEARALAERRASVVLAFVDGRPEQPIILGVVQGRPLVPLAARRTAKRAERDEAESVAISAAVDGEHVTLEGKESVELRCGKASITLTKDGKVTIRAKSISSRATGSHRLRGGSVEIN